MKSLECRRDKRNHKRNTLLGTLATIDNFCNDKLNDLDINDDMMRNVPKSIMSRFDTTKNKAMDGKLYKSLRSTTISVAKSSTKN